MRTKSRATRRKPQPNRADRTLNGSGQVGLGPGTGEVGSRSACPGTAGPRMVRAWCYISRVTRMVMSAKPVVSDLFESAEYAELLSRAPSSQRSMRPHERRRFATRSTRPKRPSSSPPRYSESSSCSAPLHLQPPSPLPQQQPPITSLRSNPHSANRPSPADSLRRPPGAAPVRRHRPPEHAPCSRRRPPNPEHRNAAGSRRRESDPRAAMAWVRGCTRPSDTNRCSIDSDPRYSRVSTGERWAG